MWQYKNLHKCVAKKSNLHYEGSKKIWIELVFLQLNSKINEFCNIRLKKMDSGSPFVNLKGNFTASFATKLKCISSINICFKRFLQMYLIEIIFINFCEELNIIIHFSKELGRKGSKVSEINFRRYFVFGIMLP